MRAVAAMLDGRSVKDSQLGDLRILLNHARNFQASDLRDNIYAFVGLAQEGYGFEPSYLSQNTAVHVFSHAARRLLEHDRDLAYLLEQAFVGRSNLGFFLPSWVPDWNCYEDRSVLLELQKLADDNNGGDSLQPPGINNGFSDKKSNFVFEENDNGQISLRVTGRNIAMLPWEWKAISRSVRQFEMDSGVVVYTPTKACPKDEIWFLFGCKWPVLLRREEEDKYCFGGVCYYPWV